MSDANPLASLASATSLLRELGVDFALVGGLAVSIRGEVRFTRDVALAIAVESDREVPVAQAEELIALKVLSASARRGQDELDLESLLRLNEHVDLGRVRMLLDLVTERGFDRGESLGRKLDTLLERFRDPD